MQFLCADRSICIFGQGRAMKSDGGDAGDRGGADRGNGGKKKVSAAE
jgi:hypothetical protein